MDYRVVGLPFASAQEEPETTGEVHEEEEHNPILPEPGELIFGALAFILVFLVLARYAFPRLSEGLRSRTEKIQADLEKAEKSREEAQAVLERYEEQLRDARGEAGRIIEEARKTAEAMRRDVLAKAEDESRRIVARAQEEIRAERDRAFEELRRHVADLSVDLASRVIGESLDKKRQAKLVEDYIDELSRTGDGQRSSASPPTSGSSKPESGSSKGGRPGGDGS